MGQHLKREIDFLANHVIAFLHIFKSYDKIQMFHADFDGRFFPIFTRIERKWFDLAVNKIQKRGLVPLDRASMWREEMGGASVPRISYTSKFEESPQHMGTILPMVVSHRGMFGCAIPRRTYLKALKSIMMWRYASNHIIRISTKNILDGIPPGFWDVNEQKIMRH
jgi:hypothetical protein